MSSLKSGMGNDMLNYKDICLYSDLISNTPALSNIRWLEEIERKQAELMAALVALEKLRQQDQLLATENEMLKVEALFSNNTQEG